MGCIHLGRGVQFWDDRRASKVEEFGAARRRGNSVRGAITTRCAAENACVIRDCWLRLVDSGWNDMGFNHRQLSRKGVRRWEPYASGREDVGVWLWGVLCRGAVVYRCGLSPPDQHALGVTLWDENALFAPSCGCKACKGVEIWGAGRKRYQKNTPFEPSKVGSYGAYPVVT